jgi:hypothetical protein
LEGYDVAVTATIHGILLPSSRRTGRPLPGEIAQPIEARRGKPWLVEQFRFVSGSLSEIEFTTDSRWRAVESNLQTPETPTS